MSGTAESLASSFFESAPMPLAVLDRGGTLVIMNGAWKALLDEPSSALGKALVDLFDVADTGRIGPLPGSDAGSAPTTFVATLAGASTGQASRPMRFHLAPDVASGTFHLLATDASDAEAATRTAELELREKTAAFDRQNLTLKMFSHVIDNAAFILWSMDVDGVCTNSEGKGVEFLGLPAGSMVGQNVFDMYKDTPEVLGFVVRALGGEESRFLSSLSELHFDTWLLPIREPDGSVSGVIGLAMDATERVRNERELREKLELIGRQSATIRALATPIIQVWDEVLCLPVIGTVDSARTADMMQSLLETIVREQARYAIVDLTGVEVVDTSTADHLIRLFRAAKVLGVDGILCGIRPAVAQTIVALGLDLASVRTMRSLRDALIWCIRTKAAARTKQNDNDAGVNAVGRPR